MPSAPAAAAATGLPRYPASSGTQLAWTMAFLDDCGATFEDLGDDRFAANYRLPGGEDKRWICRDVPEDIEQGFARAFRLRVAEGRH